ncbi:helix-turn-helix domain-containing protein [Candidatus Allofournierella merdavium]|uniref:helix-turn-helix domain-containing protein n=1 Tax=Candidatus Allofournierella merdavium TaxID=2838593 RepID=UPI00374FC0DC
MEQANTLKMGATIAALRKARGLTQEQLAALVGVSGPAVSKWETDASCPDIALLCPLARALDTTVDALLQFEATLTDAEATRQINALMEEVPQKGADAAEEALRRLVRRWPGCTALQFNAAVVCDGFEMFFPDAPAEQKAGWRAFKRELLERVRASGAASYWQAATIQLASLALVEEETDRAQALLDELPQHPGDATTVRVLLLRKQGREEEAQKLLQTQLYTAASKAMSLLAMLLGSDVEPRRRQKLLEAYRAVAGTFGFPDMSEGLLMEQPRKAGEWDEAARHFSLYVDQLLSPLPRPDADLFAPALDCEQKPGDAFPAGMRRLLLDGIRREMREDLRRETGEPELWEHPVFAAALKKLEAGV